MAPLWTPGAPDINPPLRAWFDTHQSVAELDGAMAMAIRRTQEMIDYMVSLGWHPEQLEVANEFNEGAMVYTTIVRPKRGTV